MTSPYLEKPLRSFDDYLKETGKARESHATYLPVCVLSDGAWIMESRLGMTKGEIIDRLIEAQYESVNMYCSAVWRIDPHEGSFEDVSEEIAQATLAKMREGSSDWPDYVPALVEEYCLPGLNDWQAEL